MSPCAISQLCTELPNNKCKAFFSADLACFQRSNQQIPQLGQKNEHVSNCHCWHLYNERSVVHGQPPPPPHMQPTFFPSDLSRMFCTLSAFLTRHNQCPKGRKDFLGTEGVGNEVLAGTTVPEVAGLLGKSTTGNSARKRVDPLPNSCTGPHRVSCFP